MNGITVRENDVELTSEFKEIINSLKSKIQFRGHWYVQLKSDKKEQLKYTYRCLMR